MVDQAPVLGRFDLEDVEPGTRQVFRLERFEKRLVVDDSSARTIDQKRTRFHLLDPLGRDQIAGFVRQRHVQRHDIGGSENTLQGVHLDIQPLGRPRRPDRIEGYDLHAEATRPMGHRLTNLPRPTTPQGLAVELAADELLAVPFAGS